MQPGNIKNIYYEKQTNKQICSVVLNLTVYARKVISFFYKQKHGEIPILRTFLGTKFNFGQYNTVNRQFK